MQEVLVQVYSHLRGIWKRRWSMLLLAWLICLVGWVFVLKMPDQYSSSAKVYVDTQSVLQPLLRGIAIQSNVEQQVELMTRTLFSRPNLEKAARMTDLDLNVRNEQEMDALLTSLKSRVEFGGGGRQNIYTISYEDKNPEMSKKVVQSFLTIFVESSLGSSRKDSGVAQKFIDVQIKEYESRLVEAEARLKEFKQKNVAMMPGSGGDYFNQLKAATTTLSLNQDRLSEIVKRRDELKRQIADEEPTLGLDPSANVFSGGLAHPLDERIAGMQGRLDDLLLKYTDKYPDVVSLVDTMSRLKEQRQKELDEAKEKMPEAASAAPAMQQNPVYQQLKISLGQADAEIVALKSRVEKAKRDVESLEGLVDTIPAVEAEMKSLNRDYNIVKSNYEQLLNRRESAHMAQEAEATGDSVKFKVVEPPRVPLAPTGPNRPLLLSVVMAAALAAGVALAFFISQLRQTFDTRVSLRDATQLPVLGSVAMEWTSVQRMKLRIETAVFIVSGCFLLLAYFVALIMQERLAGILSQVGV